MNKLSKRMLMITGVVGISLSGFLIWRYQARNYTVVLRDGLHANNEEEPSSLRVGTYNVKSLNMGESLAAFQEDLSAIDLDILCVQEVDHKAFRSGHQEMIKEMGEAAGFPYHYFFQSMWMVDGYYGIGILSKYPIQMVESRQLPNYLLSEPRILAHAQIKVGTRTLQVYNTHLAYKDAQVRQEEIEYLRNHVDTSGFSILMGDFNVFTMDGFFSIQGMRAVSHPEHVMITFRTFGFPDNIFYSDKLTMKDVQVQPSSFSDHNLLYGTLYFNE